MLCKFCNNAPPIRESHVIPRFMGTYIKKNSPFGNMINLWSGKTVLDLLKGPYFCTHCDNVVISGWENYFSSNVWPAPLKASAKWTQPESINFILSLAYRYAIHFMETSPITISHSYSDCVRKNTESAIRNNSLVGNSIFIYPYIHRAITQESLLLPGVNHLLSLAVHGQSLPQEEDLPNAFLVIVPKMLFLFCDRDLTGCHTPNMKNPIHLIPNKSFDPSTANIDMPLFIYSVLNKLIGETKIHQKKLGLWKKLAYGTDKILNPQKVCYLAQSQDQVLLSWKNKNCR